MRLDDHSMGISNVLVLLKLDQYRKSSIVLIVCPLSLHCGTFAALTYGSVQGMPLETSIITPPMRPSW